MPLSASSSTNNFADDLAREMQALVQEVYPYCRSITGPGVRDTLRVLQRYLPLEIVEVPTGTRVFDWHVPKEWRIHDAYIKDPAGRRIVDFRASNLHVVSYSVAVRAKLSRAELLPHLRSLPDSPQWIPYRTSYYEEDWGFCLTHEQLVSLPDQEYEVCIDSELVDGSLSYGEVYLPGQTQGEVLVSAHVCHPSLANDNLSGVAVAAFLARHLLRRPRRYSYRFVFAPGTIGAITWLATHEAERARVRHGLVLALLGGPGPVTYKKTRRGDAEIDRAAAHVLQHWRRETAVVDFAPLGYDERQYCSPGLNLPVGRLTRGTPEQFPEYHSSADNCALLQSAVLADSWAVCAAIIDVLEANGRYRNTCPNGEPQLAPRGLNASLDGHRTMIQPAILWVLNLSDGTHSLLDIAARSGLDFQLVRQAAEVLLQGGLLTPVDSPAKVSP